MDLRPVFVVRRGRHAVRKKTTFATRHCINRAILLRNATPAERAFARYLAGLGYAYRQQQGFLTPFYRIADFYLPDRNLIIEIDGGYHRATTALDQRKWARPVNWNTTSC